MHPQQEKKALLKSMDALFYKAAVSELVCALNSAMH